VAHDRNGSEAAVAGHFGHARSTPQSRHSADALRCPFSAEFVAKVS
jgi:hypothetical protein